ncbi:hypothetical protein ACHWQZ_G003382 [Mnemiopsis leidyi]
MGSSGRPVSVCNAGYCPVPVERPDLQRFPSQNKSRTPSAHNSYTEASIGVCGQLLLIFAYLTILVTFPFSLLVCIKVIQEYERAVIFRLGRIAKGGARGPGLCFYLPCLDEVTVVDMRTLSFAVPPQEILTKDSVTVSVDAVVYFRISSAVASVCNVEGVQKSTRLLAQTTLRNILGTKSLSDLLSEREAISHDMQHSLDQATDPWGVVVERVEIKDVRLPANLQRAMAAEAEAFREAKAKEIAADGERNAAQALRDASDTMMQSPCAIQLRYLQTLTTIASEQNSTIVFPVPVDLLGTILAKPDRSEENRDVRAHSLSDGGAILE